MAANGGDELLLKTLKKYFKKIVNSKVSATTTSNKVSCRFIKGKCLLDEYIVGHRVFENDTLDKISRKTGIKNENYFRSRLGRVFPKVSETRNLIEKSDYVILMPGGYLNDYYGMEKILEIVEKIREMKKPIYIFGHSVGPFRSKDSKNNFKSILKKCEKVILRERKSYKHVENLVKNGTDKVSVSTDIAFAFRNLVGKGYESQKDRRNKKTLLNFRKWPYKCSIDKIVSVGYSLSKKVIKKDNKVTFISTCQGVEGYKNDSKVSKKIANKLRKNGINKGFEVVEKRYSPRGMIKKMSNYDIYIGMRMHGAISAMLAGVPAFNIGYEHKSKGIYEYIGITEYTESIKSNREKIFSKVSQFLDQDTSEKKKKFERAVKYGSKEALKAFKLLREEVHSD